MFFDGALRVDVPAYGLGFRFSAFQLFLRSSVARNDGGLDLAPAINHLLQDLFQFR
jgi:hypothetical protein